MRIVRISNNPGHSLGMKNLECLGEESDPDPCDGRSREVGKTTHRGVNYLEVFEKHGGRRKAMAIWRSETKMAMKYGTSDPLEGIAVDYERAVLRYQKKITESRPGSREDAQQGPVTSQPNIGRSHHSTGSRHTRHDSESQADVGAISRGRTSGLNAGSREIMHPNAKSNAGSRGRQSSLKAELGIITQLHSNSDARVSTVSSYRRSMIGGDAVPDRNRIEWVSST